MSKISEEIKKVRDIQGYKGNWDYSEYMWGMYNGLELALAIAEGRDPQYKSKPKKYGEEPKAPSNIDKLRSWLKGGWLK